MVLKNHEHELSYIFTDLFNMYMKQSCLSDFWKTALADCVLENVEMSKVKNYCPVPLQSAVKKIFEMLTNR